MLMNQENADMNTILLDSKNDPIGATKSKYVGGLIGSGPYLAVEARPILVFNFTPSAGSKMPASTSTWM